MERVVFGVASLVMVGIVAHGLYSSLPPPSKGQAPAFTLPAIDGSSVTLGNLRGRSVVLAFWSTRCGPCIEEIPTLNAYAEGHPEVTVLGISVDKALSTDALFRRAEKLGFAFPVLHDRGNSVRSAYRVNGIPAHFLIDETGMLVGNDCFTSEPGQRRRVRRELFGHP